MIKPQNISLNLRRKYFWWSFWLILLLLAGLYLWAQFRVSKLVQTADGQVAIEEGYSTLWRAVLPEVIAGMSEYFEAAQQDIEVRINANIDQAFSAVYPQIEPFVDFHYSLTGEYTELLSALAGDISADLQRILFDDIQFDQRLQQAQSQIYQQAEPIIVQAFKNTRTDMQQAMNFNDQEMGLLGKIVVLSSEDAQARFSQGYSTLRLASTAAAGTLAAKVMSKKLATKMAAKLAAKGGLKAVAAATGAGTGALAGAWGGPVGAVIGGALGAIVAWVATDQIMISVDEYFNREEFTRELVALIDEQKAHTKATLAAGYAAQLQYMVTSNRDSLKNLPTTGEIIRQQNQNR